MNKNKKGLMLIVIGLLGMLIAFVIGSYGYSFVLIIAPLSAINGILVGCGLSLMYNN